MIEINSLTNDTIKLIASLKDLKGRREQGMFLIEGVKVCEEALLAGSDIIYLIMTKSFYESGGRLFDREDLGDKTILVEDRIMDKLADTKTPQGVAMVLPIPSISIDRLSTSKSILYLDGISDPGNMGTLIRTAEASGFDMIACSLGCVDIYNPKVVRSTMGSILRMPISVIPLRDIKAFGYRLYATTLKATKNYNDVYYQGKICIIIGNESSGISEENISLVDEHIKIPMYGRAESLNAAVAGGIVMYAAKVSNRD